MSRRDDGEADSLGHDAGVAAVLARIEHHGGDLSKPLPVDHFLYFPRAGDAQRVEQRLRAQGYETQLDAPSAGRPGWLVQATKLQVVSYESIVDEKRRLGAIAEEDDGVYDGWGVQLD